MNQDPKFYVSRARKGALSPRVADEGPFITAGAAIHWAKLNSTGFRSVTVLRDSCGSDHPDNAGKRFLHSIVK
jgi:hypothetical protein